MTIGIVFMIIGGLLAAIGLCNAIVKDKPEWLMLFVFGLMVFSVSVCVECRRPTRMDVINGNAEYYEILYIHDTDTIKTYKLRWKEGKGGTKKILFYDEQRID